MLIAGRLSLELEEHSLRASLQYAWSRRSEAAVIWWPWLSRRSSSGGAGFRPQSSHAGFVPCVEEAEVQSCPAVEQAEPDQVHEDEKRGRLRRYPRKYDVLEDGADHRSRVLAVPQRMQPLPERPGLTALRRFEFRIAHMFVEPRRQALVILIHEVVA